MLEMPTAPPAAGEQFSLGVRIPFVGQPTDEDYGGAGALEMVPIDPVKVAGPEPRLGSQAPMESFMRLYQWIMGNDHEPVGGVAYSSLTRPSRMALSSGRASTYAYSAPITLMSVSW